MRLSVKLLLWVVGFLFLLAWAMRIWIWHASNDIPPQDFHDLDFPFKNVQAETNAFTWFQAAAKAAVWDERERIVYKQFCGGTVDVKAVESILATNAQTLALLRRGLACSVCQPPLITNLETFSYNVPSVNFYMMANVLKLDYQWKNRKADMGGALKDCLDLLHLGGMEVQQSTGLIGYLVAYYAISSGAEIGHEIVTSNQLDETTLRTLDDALQWLDTNRTGCSNALRGEFQFFSGIVDVFYHGRLTNDFAFVHQRQKRGRFWTFLFKPNETRLFYAEGIREGIRDEALPFKAMKFRDIEKELGTPKSFFSRAVWCGNAFGKVLIAALVPNVSGVLKQHCIGECEIAGLRLSIACQRYEHKNGHLPEKLDDLVPEFIERVPSDPFDGEPFRYSKAKRIVWSVGENLTDNGGSKIDRTTGVETNLRRRMMDYVIDLPPPPAP